jgi:hypothetical protein
MFGSAAGCDRDPSLEPTAFKLHGFNGAIGD